MTQRALSSFLGSTVRSVLPLAIGLAACNAPAATPDAGVDAPPPFLDAGYPRACDGDITVVNGELGVTETLTFDTSMTLERPRDLGPSCGNVATTAMWAGQEVIEYHVPGTGRVGVAFDTRFPETAPNFNTLVQVRTSCATVPSNYPPTCFDDPTSTEPRAAGGFDAMGGDTVYLIVTAHSDPEAITGEVDQGPLRIDITPTANTAPTIETAEVVLIGDALRLELTANDAEGGPIVAYALSLYTASGQVDFDGDGLREPEDSLIFGFDAVGASAPFLAQSELTPADDGYQIAAFCRQVGCTQAGIVVFDSAYAGSTLRMVPIMEATRGGPGDACTFTQPCQAGATCGPTGCVSTSAAITVCGGAMALGAAMPTDPTMPTVTTVTGTIGAGNGVFEATCGAGGGMSAADASAGKEAIYSLELTGTGPYNVTFSTAGAGTGSRDTILYVRSDCLDETTTLDCNDDISGSSLASSVTLNGLGPGFYYVFIEAWGGVSSPAGFGLTTTISL